MALVNRTRVEIRREVRRIIRSDGFPKEDIDAAINRVIEQINVMGRFKFHDFSTTFSLTADTWQYTMTGSSGFELIAEETLIYDAATDPKPSTLPTPQVLTKIPSLHDAINSGYFLTSGDKPKRYLMWQGKIWLDPIPNANATKSVTIYYQRDLLPLTDDLDTMAARFPRRYEYSVLAVGAALEIEPMLEVNSAGGVGRLNNIYQRSLRNMREQELWEPLVTKKLLRDNRWKNAHKWGNTGSVI